MGLGPIALLTDFGLRDPFVGIMKGVIMRINPSATVVDLCHELDPGDIRAAGFALAMAFPYMPEGTIFTVVVDPSVGTQRQGVAAEIDGRIFVGPDNGILSWVLKSRRIERAVRLENAEFFLPEVSDTFHGRDVFAPVAAHLSKGVPLDAFGPAVKDLSRFPIPELVISDRALQGEVVYVDRFGNLLTNITRQEFERWRKKQAGDNLTVHFGSVEIRGISRTYGDVPPGHAVALFGSVGVLEVAVNGDSAAETLGVSMGLHVLVCQSPS
ncbi:MAG TPA: SAM-dependent chlorinase/fluorinase [Armatimonadota bacterium]|nr:SAM-dependent chlorinase/fluorinase [Armatimonadota bacterium]